MRHLSSRIILLALACCGVSCFSPRETLSIQYFAVDAPAVVAATDGAPFDLRLRRITCGDHLRERFVWARAGEYGFDETRRWTQMPIAFVQRALEGALFDSGAAQRQEGVGALTLDVRVEAFERTLDAAGDQARIVLHVAVANAVGRGKLSRAYEALEPIDGTSGTAIAAAFSRALSDVVAAVTQAVVATNKGS